MDTTTLPAPSQEYLNQSELASWLGLDADDLRELIKDGDIPKGKPRKGKARAVWTRQEAAICKWLVDNPERFNGVSSQE